MIFCNDSGGILFGISPLRLGDQTFLSEERLKELTNAYKYSENDQKHETPLAKKLLRKEPQLLTPLKKVLSFKRPSKASFDCSYMLLLVAVTLPSPALHAREVFQK